MEIISDTKIPLFFVTDKDKGFYRIRKGKGFIYLNNGKRITDQGIVERIKNLKIPPNWKNVWICKDPHGYLQATGFDAKNRKQYIYHKEWTALQQDNKFEKLAEFAGILPEIRKTINNDLNKRGWPKEKVLALIVSVMDANFMRIGNNYYKEQNETYGLTTLRRKHLTINGNSVVFSYKGKSNIYRIIKIENKRFANLIKKCSELPGYEIFRYINGEGVSLPVSSKDVNEYLEKITGYHFTSKTFITWGATVLAIKKFDEAKKETESNKRLKLKKAIVKKVSKELGNTASVCELYYIHPKVLNLLSENNFSAQNYIINNHIPGLEKEEMIALDILAG